MKTNDLEFTLGPLQLIPPGEGRNFEVLGERIAVFHTRSGEVFATQAECPHRNGPLADGLVGGRSVICPLHAWKFDLATGEPLLGSCKLTTYPVRLTADGKIVLTLCATPALSAASTHEIRRNFPSAQIPNSSES